VFFLGLLTLWAASPIFLNRLIPICPKLLNGDLFESVTIGLFGPLSFIDPLFGLSFFLRKICPIKPGERCSGFRSADANFCGSKASPLNGDFPNTLLFDGFDWYSWKSSSSGTTWSWLLTLVDFCLLSLRALPVVGLWSLKKLLLLKSKG
jgi:hypothetical protein